MIGTLGAATLRREHVVALMTARAEKPDRANLLRRVLRALMQHAIEIGMRDDDPTRDVKAIKRKNATATIAGPMPRSRSSRRVIRSAASRDWHWRCCSTPGNAAPTW